MTDTNTSERSFFDLHITGLGYLNRVREVKPKKGEPFLACDISALNGPSDEVSYVRFDTRVSGSDAQHLVRRCKDAVEDDKKVMIGFKLGDLWTDLFTYTKGGKAGQQGVSLKARLLFINWIKVDGVLKYRVEPRQAQDQGASEEDAATVPAPQETVAAEATAPASEPAAETAQEREPALADSF